MRSAVFRRSRPEWKLVLDLSLWPSVVVVGCFGVRPMQTARATAPLSDTGSIARVSGQRLHTWPQPSASEQSGLPEASRWEEGGGERRRRKKRKRRRRMILNYR